MVTLIVPAIWHSELHGLEDCSAAASQQMPLLRNYTLFNAPYIIMPQMLVHRRLNALPFWLCSHFLCKHFSTSLYSLTTRGKTAKYHASEPRIKGI